MTTMPVANAAAQAKRFVEWWIADPAFRDAVKGGAPRARGLEVDPEELRLLWDESNLELLREMFAGRASCPSSVVREYLDHVHAKYEVLEQVRRESIPADARFAAWRARQIERMRTSFEPRRFFALTHPLFACELSEGCSVGCWFCGISAPKLNGHYRFAGNEDEWRALLEVFAGAFGSRAAAHGFLYWATDPFDNVDYESFCAAFRERFGISPHTTTALSLRNPERTRRFIREFGEERPAHVRFSILALTQLQQLYALFTPEELTNVEISLQNAGSLQALSLSGRARQYSERVAQRQVDSDRYGQSIACVSGFLVNCVRRTVRLITPCTPDDRWPLGYYVYEERPFASPDELRECIDDMTCAYMPLAVRDDRPVLFRRGVRYERDGFAFVAVTPYGRQRIEGSPYWGEVGDLVAAGRYTVATIRDAFRERYGIPADVVDHWIAQVFAQGLLDEEPPRQDDDHVS